MPSTSVSMASPDPRPSPAAAGPKPPAPSPPEPTKPTVAQILRYRFDNLMARGAVAQIALLFLISAVLVFALAIVINVFGLAPDESGARETFSQTLWRLAMRALDAGNVAGDQAGGYAFVFLMLFMTMGGIFVVSTLIGVLNNSITTVLENLQRGKSLVVERGHTVILGFTPKVHTMLSELAEANSNKPGACVVVLADRDKAEMDEEIRSRLEKKLRVVTRSGSPTSIADLALANLPEAKSVIVLAPEDDEDGEPYSPQESDTFVLKTLLAIAKAAPARNCHVVAEVQQEATLAVARMVAGESAGLVLTPPLISRLLVQTGRQSGLSIVYTELLDFAGAEIYMQEEPAVTGKTFRETMLAYEDSAMLGVMQKDGELLLPPAMSRPMQPGDMIIAISEDDDTLKPNGRGVAGSLDAIVRPSGIISRRPERTLVLGASERLSLVLSELNEYVAPGSEAIVVGFDHDGTLTSKLDMLDARLGNLEVTFNDADLTDRAVLDALDVGSFDQVLVLSEHNDAGPDVADARTMIALLHLRDIERKGGKSIQVTSEILDIQNRELASVAEADDFVVSNTLVSLLMSQVSENHHLVRVFEQLFRPEGHEVYLRPATEYVQAGADIDFYTLVEAAAARGEVAIGYRMAHLSTDPSAAYGVVVNPKKSTRISLTEHDKIVVLAEGA